MFNFGKVICPGKGKGNSALSSKGVTSSLTAAGTRARRGGRNLPSSPPALAFTHNCVMAWAGLHLLRIKLSRGVPWERLSSEPPHITRRGIFLCRLHPWNDLRLSASPDERTYPWLTQSVPTHTDLNTPSSRRQMRGNRAKITPAPGSHELVPWLLKLPLISLISIPHHPIRLHVWRSNCPQISPYIFKCWHPLSSTEIFSGSPFLRKKGTNGENKEWWMKRLT